MGELLLNAGIFRDAKTKVDRTALQMAAEEGHVVILEMLINHGADVNTKDMLKMTALHWAVQHCHREAVALLLQHGADVMAVNKFGKSPLGIACDSSTDSIIELLQAAVHQASNTALALESETATEKLMNELAADKQTEHVLDKLTSCTSESSSTEAVKLLESHGISFLPADETTLLTSALESGQSLSLTEAGKMALNQTKTVVPRPTVQPPPLKRFKLPTSSSVTSSSSSPLVVTITAEQFLALAGRLQQGKSNKPMVISLPKQFVLPAAHNGKKNTATSSLNKKSAAPTAATARTTTAAAAAAAAGSLVTSLSELSKSISSAWKNVTNPIKVMKPTILNLPDIGDVSSPPSSPAAMPHIDVEESQKVGDDSKDHFFKSGLLKGSARTTPMTLLCRRVKAASKSTLPSTSTVNDDSFSLDNCPDLFNEESESSKSVWLSIMEEENSQFTTNDDDDLLDPTRLAAQLASIRQAASQYSFSS